MLGGQQPDAGGPSHLDDADAVSDARLRLYLAPERSGDGTPEAPARLRGHERVQGPLSSVGQREQIDEILRPLAAPTRLDRLGGLPSRERAAEACRAQPRRAWPRLYNPARTDREGPSDVTMSREELVGIAHAERQRLGRMIQYADPTSWDKPSAATGWWNRDVIAHLGAGDTAAAQLLAGLPAEELDLFRSDLGSEPFATDAWNAWTVNRRSETPTRTLIETWGAAAESLLEYATRLDEEEWRDNRYPWLAGDIAATYLVQSRVVEWFLHGEDMRATNGVAEGWQINWQHCPCTSRSTSAFACCPGPSPRRGTIWRVARSRSTSPAPERASGTGASASAMCLRPRATRTP